jgi:hypothetical protein
MNLSPVPNGERPAADADDVAVWTLTAVTDKDLRWERHEEGYRGR